MTVCAVWLPLQAQLPNIQILQRYEATLGDKVWSKFSRYPKWWLYPGSLTGAELNTMLSFCLFFMILISIVVFLDSFYAPGRWSSEFNAPNLFWLFPLISWSYIFCISMASAFFNLRYGRKAALFIMVGYILVSVVFISLVVPFSYVINGRFYVSLFDFTYLSPVISNWAGLANLERLIQYDQTNLKIFGVIPIYYLTILIYCSVGYYFYIETRKLHQKMMEKALQKEKQLQNSSPESLATQAAKMAQLQQSATAQQTGTTQQSATAQQPGTNQDQEVS